MFNNDPFEDMGYVSCDNSPQYYTVKELRKLYKEFKKGWHINCTTEVLDFLKWLKKEEKK